LSYLYLIRHGQAGTRENYDTLSRVGVEQSRLLGEYFASQAIRFDAAYTGGLKRQLATAREVIDAYARAGVWFPEPAEDPGWREFDLDHVYQGHAAHLCAEDPEFQSEYEVLLAEIAASRGVDTAEVHRRFSPCDIKVIEAWVRERFPYDGESWSVFRERVSGALLPDGDARNVIVFTSATPTSIWAGRALDLNDARVFRIAAVLYNTSITVLRVRAGEVRLFSMNGVPHLINPELRTHR